MRSPGFIKGFIKAAVEAGYSQVEAQELLKVANPLKALVNWGVPLGAGAGAGYAAHEQGASPLMTLAYGAGATQIASPRQWMNIVRTAKGAPDPFTSASSMIMKDLGKKVGIVGGVAMAEQAPEILSNIKATTGNSAAISNSLAKEAPDIAKNLSGGMQGLNQSFSTKGPLAQGLNSLATASRTLESEVPKLTGAVGQLSGQASKTLDTINNKGIPVEINVGGVDKLKQSVSDAYNNLTPNQRLGLGIGGAGIGTLLLSRLLRRREPRPRRTVYEY